MKQVGPDKFEAEPFPICGTRTGSLSCLSRDRKSDLSQYGSGIVTYFQSLKYLTWVFFVMTILSIPSMTFYVSGNLEIPSNLKSAITAVSLGNIGASLLACNSGTYQYQADLQDYKATISLQCSYGTLDGIREFGQVSVASYIDCASFETSTSSTDAATSENSAIAFYP